jgi:hypothetical protein
MAKVNSKMAVLVKGLENPINFAGAANDKARVRLLRDMISNEEMNQSEVRFYLDKMQPECRASLYVMLTALEAAVT